MESLFSVREANLFVESVSKRTMGVSHWKALPFLLMLTHYDMADEKKTYKYIDTDLDQEHLLKNLKHNAQAYVKHKKWDEGRAREFYDALTSFENALSEGRLSTDQSGAVLDSSGQLNDGTANWRDKDGNVLTQEQYDALKKKDRKNVTNDFYANREVAGYLNAIAKNLYDKTAAEGSQKKETLKFNLGKHGLWNKFVNSMAPGGTGDIEAWLDADPYDEKLKKRGTANRAKLLNDYITQYRSKLPEDLDFSDTNYGSREEYLKSLDRLQEELSNGVSDVDYRLINQLGGSPDQYRAFFTTDKQYISPNSPEQTPENQEPVQQEQPVQNSIPVQQPSGMNPAVRTRLRNNDLMIRKAYNALKVRWYKPVDGSAPQGIEYDKSAKDPVKAYWNALNAAGKSFKVDRLRTTTGREYMGMLEQFGEVNPGMVRHIAFGKYAGWYYIPESINKDNWSVLGYNPTTHSVGRLFYPDISPDTKKDYASILAKIDNMSQEMKKPVFQEGGNISQGESVWDFINGGEGQLGQFNAGQAAQSKITKGDPKNRQPQKKENGYSSTNFTSTDYARLAAIGADIAALVDPEPISAGVLGVGSDVTNFVSDLKEGYGVMNSLGNFAANLGLSAIGLIPVLGDAAGSGSKVVKSLIKLSPKISKALFASGVLTGVSNADEIVKSFSKIGKSGPENDMSMSDWRNIGLGIQLLLGGANMAKNARAAKKFQAAKEASKTNHVDVKVRNTSTGDEQVMRFLGPKDTAKLNKAKTPQEVNEVIDSHPSYKGQYEVVTDTKTGHSWLGENSSWLKPWTWRQKTSTNILQGESVNPVYDIKGLRKNYNDLQTGRTRYLMGSMKETSPDIIVPGQTTFTRSFPYPMRTDPALGPLPVMPGKPLLPSPPPTRPQVPFRNDIAAESSLLARAKAYREAIKSTVGKKHSPEYSELINRGRQGNELRSLGLWKEGGRLMPKAQLGMLVRPEDPKPFGKGLSTLNMSAPQLTKPDVSLPFDNGNRPIQYTSTPNYGTGYSSNRDYSNKEYGTTNKVNLSGIKAANAKLRDRALHPEHMAPQYDYTDAQANTDKVRGIWQSNPNNRTNDLMRWVSAWAKENPGQSQLKMLADYNRQIDKMYDYKRAMGTPTYSGDRSYRHGNAVAMFNRRNRAIYGSANAPSGVHGYSVPQENFNGTTTAQRFIDITDNDISDLKFNFKPNAPESFKQLFNGLVKDKTGRYYVQDRTMNIPKLEMPVPDLEKTPLGPGTSPTHPPVDNTNPPSPAKVSPNWGNLISDMLPDALAAGRYLAALQHNRDQLDLAKKMPVMLYDPMEAHKWMFGDEQAVMSGRRSAGQLNHMASRPVTSDAAQAQAAQLEAFMKGREYITQGERQDAANRERTAEAEWQQERMNQQSRYNTAMQNRQNLFGKKVNDLNAEAMKRRADYESLNGLMAQLEQAARAKREQDEPLREQAEQASLQNDISANMSAYGIPATPDEQQLINDLLTGNRKLSSLSEDEAKSYQRLSNAIQEEVARRVYASKGISYRPFTPREVAGTTFSIRNYGSMMRQGGVLSGDSEKVTIQKLRNRVRRMELFQKHLEARMNAYQKDMDRAQRSASQYIRGQKG